MQEESLCRSVKKHEVGFVKDALKMLIKKEAIHRYKSQNRYDYCIKRENFKHALSLLNRYSSTYGWIVEI
ncbi:hypothetical protein [Methanolapillus africanus]